MLKTSEFDSLDDYYKKKKIQVAFRDLETDELLKKYFLNREELFRKLGLPSSYFKDKKVIEFGPGSGENSMCFALLGASLTLVEPNLDSHAQISTYFNKYELKNSLSELHSSNMENFQSTNVFEFIDAEGFVATIQPSSTWLQISNRLLNKKGLLLISYFEKHGSFFERFLSTLARIIEASTAINQKPSPKHIDIVKALMENKWASTGGSRTIDTWYFDHIANPYAAGRFQIDALQLIDDTAQYGFTLQSSYPNYLDHIAVGWYKENLPETVQNFKSKEFIRRNSLSFMLGKKVFFAGKVNQLENFYSCVSRVIFQINEVESSVSRKAVETLLSNLKGLIQFILNNKDSFFSDNIDTAIGGLLLLVKSLNLAVNGDLDGIKTLLNYDDWYNGLWGTPVHYALFRKTN